MKTRYGASKEDWDHLSLTLGLTQDLLPVVSNPKAEISANSKMKGLGKTPSRYNHQRKVAGIAKWTQHNSTLTDIEKWRLEDDYGICLQSRLVRAFDIDSENRDVVEKIELVIMSHCGILPKRMRSNSNKCLRAFRLPGELPKRIIRLKDGEGIIELLGTGQQFVACGTHTSGARYEWVDGLPEEIPTLTLEQVDAIWQELAQEFGESSIIESSPSKAKVLGEAIANDPIATHLLDHDWVKSSERDGRLHIRCPYENEHSGESADSATTYFPANTGGYAQGHFDCKHAHCAHRTDDDFKVGVGAPYDDPFDDFEVLPLGTKGTTGDNVPNKAQDTDEKVNRFPIHLAADFAKERSQEWLIKKVLPRGGLGVLYGESASGKSFLALDMVGSILTGEDWRGHRVRKGKAVYICAEGANGMRRRLRAHSAHHGVDLEGIGLGIISNAPNFLHVQDIKQILESIRNFGPIEIIIVDTLAQVMSGANENAGEDMGKALAHCRKLHELTGALVLLVHHSGKDTTKGARGWSGLRAAADVEIEVVRADDDRVAIITKMKDGEDGAEYGFRLLTVPVGIDEDGDPITSCVAKEAEISRSSLKDKPETKKDAKGRNESAVMKALDDGLVAGDVGVAYNDLLEGTVRVMTDEANAGERTGNSGRYRETAAKAIRNLMDKELLVADGDRITIKTEEDL